MRSLSCLALTLLLLGQAARGQERPVVQAMDGPYPSLENFCQKLGKKDNENRPLACKFALADPPSFDTATEAKETDKPREQRHVAGLTYLSAAALPAPYLHVQVMSTLLGTLGPFCRHFLVLRLRAGWFVRELHHGSQDGCSEEGYWGNGDEGESNWGHLRALLLSTQDLLQDGGKQVVFRYQAFVGYSALKHGERVGDPKPGFAPPRAEPAGPDRQAAVTSAISRRSI